MQTKPGTAKQSLIKHLKTINPKLTDTEIPEIINGIDRFVKLVQKIYTEPQAHIYIKENRAEIGKNKKGKSIYKITKTRMIDADLTELNKVRDKSNKKEDLLDTVRKFHKIVTKDKYGR